MAEFQIRDKSFGLDLYDGDTATAALLKFIANRARADAAIYVQTFDDGSAEVEYQGELYRAVPVGWKPVPPQFERGRPPRLPPGSTLEIPFE